MKHKKVKSYPFYIKIKSKHFYACLLNEKESIQIGLYGHSNSIQYNIGDNSTWIHKIWRSNPDNRYTKTNKLEYTKALKTAIEILQEQSKRT